MAQGLGGIVNQTIWDEGDGVDNWQLKSEWLKLAAESLQSRLWTRKEHFEGGEALGINYKIPRRQSPRYYKSGQDRMTTCQYEAIYSFVGPKYKQVN